MCDITPLRNFNVFASGMDDNTFALLRACDEVQEPFEQYCIIPPDLRLTGTTTCDAANDPLDADFIFPKIFRGEIKILEDLPQILVSNAELSDPIRAIQPWNTVLGLDPNRIISFTPILTYEGFRPVASAPVLTRTAASSASTTNPIFLCMSEAGVDSDVVQLYMLDKFGLFRPQRNNFGDLIQTSYLDVTQDCIVSRDANIALVVFGSFLYKLNFDTKLWEQVEGVVQGNVRAVLLSNDTTTFVAIGQNTLTFVAPPLGETSPPYQGPIIAACFTGDQKYIMVCARVDATIMIVTCVDAQTKMTVGQCTVFITFFPLLVAGDAPYSSTCFAPTFLSDGSQMKIIISANIAYEVNVEAGFTTGNITSFRSFAISRFSGNSAPPIWIEPSGFIFFWSNGVNSILPPSALGLLTIADPLAVVNALILTDASDDMWVFLRGTLWRLQSLKLPWTNEFDVFMDFAAKISDFYENDNTDNAAVSSFVPWHYGRLSFTVPLSLFPLPTLLTTSRHLRYRWLLDGAQTGPNRFPSPLSHLERVNDFLLLYTSQKVRLYTDANVTVTSNTLWETNTHDMANDAAAFVEWTPVRRALNPIVSANGLYVLFVSNLNPLQRHVILAYNVFNNGRFAAWCNTPEFATRALQAQGEFCRNNFHVDSDVNNALFVDPRCACVGGLPLLRQLFPGLATTNADGQTSGRILANLPCISGQCAEAFPGGPEASNVYGLINRQCKKDLTVCTDVVEGTGRVDLRYVLLQQNCGASASTCLQSAECPLLQSCVEGKCVDSCTTDAFCIATLRAPLASCDGSTGRCLYPMLTDKVAIQKARNKQNLIIAAVFLALALLLLLIIIAVSVDQNRREKRVNSLNRNALVP